MQQSQRAEDNHALEYAVRQANELSCPLLVAFGLMDDYPEANLRHYRFMLEGLADVRDGLARRGIRFVVRHGPPDEVALAAAADARLVVCDRGYLRHQKAWRARVAAEAGRRVVQVESDVVVPVETVTNKAEHAARTIRPRIHRHLERFLVDLTTTPPEHDATDLRVDDGLALDDLDALLEQLSIDRSVPPVPALFQGGTGAAKRELRAFLQKRFGRYDENRNQPQTDDVSHLSKYLHFGQISPVRVALAARAAADEGDPNLESFIEELVVRRELAQNYVEFTGDYDRYAALPRWARVTLREHRDDPREHVYTAAQLEDAETHDPYWNAAMREMRYTGYMHNYMRMYWGKKILEWTNTPEFAFRTALELNNRYFLDGRDGNSYTGVAWVFGLHDRAWTERPVYGKIRYMNANGLRRKADPDAYVEKVDRLVERVTAGG
jgi:deoxyribodipyrimidine photo-lyase